MAESAQLTSLINQRVQEAVTTAQNDMLQHMDQIIKNSFDTFQKTMNESQRQLSETQLAKIEEMNSDNYVFRRKGNEEQFKVNSKVGNKMKEARCFLREDPESTEQTQKAIRSISEGLDILNHRQKLIKLADQSENGWKTVTEYETHSLADDSEDEKRIMRAENKAARKMKTERERKNKQFRTVPYSTPQTAASKFNSPVSVSNVPVQRPGKCYECGISGHWRIDHQTGAFGALLQRNKADKISKPVNNFGVSDNDISLKEVNSELSDKFAHKQCSSTVCSNDSPVGRLRESYDYWLSINANENVLSIIREGYKLPFYTEPNICFFKK